ncbi:MAG: Uma2 family endonuclease [Gemmataceae bacterium]|nr:Uma2 family endonuclease [Gemmataceae bacterium]
MSMPKPERVYSVDEYLARERAAPERHTYLDGQIYAMAGESLNHGIITVNLVVALGTQLRGKPCQALTKDSKIRSGPTPMLGRSTRGLFSYPDVIVVCGEPEFHDAHQDVILNPTAIVEVLSPSTEAFDRGDKFTRYQAWNPTLLDYVLVSQREPRIEHFHRHTRRRWEYDLHDALDMSVVLPSIDCTLKLADVYERVVFPEEEE